jgi:hypothetical protein
MISWCDPKLNTGTELTASFKIRGSLRAVSIKATYNIWKCG